MSDQWFNADYWNKKQPDNYVEITPEQQAQVDAESLAREKAKINDDIRNAISRKTPDLKKGITFERTGDFQPSFGGEIKPAESDFKIGLSNAVHHVKNVAIGFGEAVLGGIALSLTPFAALTGCSSKDDLNPLKDTPPAKNEDKPNLENNAVADAEAGICAVEIAEYAINHLNGDGIADVTADKVTFEYGMTADEEKDQAYPFIKVGGESGIKLDINTEPLLPPTTENVINYIDMAGGTEGLKNIDKYNFAVGEDGNPIIDFGSKIQLPIGVESLPDLTANNVVDYIKLVGDTEGLKNIDKYNFAVGEDGNPIIDFGGKIQLPIGVEPLPDLTANNVVDYINKVIGEIHQTEDGVGFTYTVKNGRAEVAFDNGFTHKVGDDVTVREDGTMAALQSMLKTVGVSTAPETGTSKLVTSVTLEEGSYGNEQGGFGIEIKSGDVSEIAQGKFGVKGFFDGRINKGFDENWIVQWENVNIPFDGTMEKVLDPGKYTLMVNGETKLSSAGGLHITNTNGQDIYIQYEENFGVGQAASPDDDEYTGYVVYAKDSDGIYKEKFMMADNVGLNMGVINRGDAATTMQRHNAAVGTFDANGAVDADGYYIEKHKDLDETRIAADDYYDLKHKDLDETRTAADDHYDVKHKDLDETRAAADQHYDEKNTNLIDTHKKADEEFKKLLGVDYVVDAETTDV